MNRLLLFVVAASALCGQTVFSKKGSIHIYHKETIQKSEFSAGYFDYQRNAFPYFYKGVDVVLHPPDNNIKILGVADTLKGEWDITLILQGCKGSKQEFCLQTEVRKTGDKNSAYTEETKINPIFGSYAKDGWEQFSYAITKIVIQQLKEETKN